MVVDKMFRFFDYNKYVVLNGVLQLILYTKEKNAILFTYPPEVRFSELLKVDFFIDKQFLIVCVFFFALTKFLFCVWGNILWLFVFACTVL